MKLSDAVLGVLVMLGGAALAWHAQSFPRTPVQAYGPGFFPTLLGLSLVLCGALLAARGLGARQPVLALDAWARSPAAWLRIALVPGVVLAYLALAPRAGFLAAAALPTFLMLAFLTRRPVLSAAVAAGTAASMWLVFAEILLVPLPRGPLEALLP